MNQKQKNEIRNKLRIGTHIPKSGKFLQSLRAFYEIRRNAGRPSQIFSGAAQFWRRPKVDTFDLAQTKSYLEAADLKVFIHSIYLINMGIAPTAFQEKAFDCLKWELEAGVLAGFKGVVVHCGKSLKLEPTEALENMYANMRAMLPYIDKSCPLLLETSAGQGTELCHEYEQLRDFYSAFSDEEREKIRICIDTCHVFAAGHDPLEFIANWEADFPGTIALIHFNDSAEPCGQRKDRHARPGQGYIGLAKLTAVAKWSLQNGLVPLVME